MQVVFGRYKMAARAWLSLLAFSIAVNVLFIVVPAALLFSPVPGGSIFAAIIGIPLGVGIAIGPALLTVVIAGVFASLRGYFSFLQFAVIGTLVSTSMAALGIEGHAFLLDHVFTLMLILPFAWIGGWLVAYFIKVLPEPLPRGEPDQITWRQVGGVIISISLIVTPFMALHHRASQITEERAFAREAERRGNCPDGLECAVYGVAPEVPDDTAYVVHLAGQQFVLPSASIEYGVRNTSPGDAGEILLTSQLPNFTPRSATNEDAFRFPYNDLANVRIAAVCKPSGYCRSTPTLLTVRRGGAEAPEIIYVTGEHPLTPAGLYYLGDVQSGDAWQTTTESADRHVFVSGAREDHVVCARLQDVPNPSCEHTFVWRQFLVEIRYQDQWLAHWSEIKSNVVAKLKAATGAMALQNDAIHIVEPLR